MDALDHIAGNVGLFLGYSLIAILIAFGVWALAGAKHSGHDDDSTKH